MSQNNLARAAVVLLLLACPACPDPEEPQVAPKTNSHLTNVRVLEIKKGNLTTYTRASGFLLPVKSVRISAEETGLVEKLDLEKGDPVRQGEEILRINAEVLEANLNAAEAEYRLRQGDFERAKTLFEKKSITRQAMNAATAARDGAKASLDVAKSRFRKAVISSPLTGVVTEKSIEEGELVQPGMHMLTIEDLSSVKVAVALPEKDIRFYSSAKSATIEIDALPGRSFQGKVVFVSPHADSSTGTFDTEILLDNKDRLLRAGMLARVQLTREHFEERAVIPQNAIVETENGSGVFVLKEGRARFKPVRVRAIEDEKVLVEGEIGFGDRLVVQGQRELAEGAEVKVIAD